MSCIFNNICKMSVATCEVIVQRLHESNIVRAGQLVGSTPDYWSGSGLTNRTVSSGLDMAIYCVIYVHTPQQKRRNGKPLKQKVHKCKSILSLQKMIYTCSLENESSKVKKAKKKKERYYVCTYVQGVHNH